MNTDDRKPAWDEADSRAFLDLGRFFVPGREEQIDALCSLVPDPGAGGHLVELCCGEGLLSRTLLERFPGARVHAYDGSPAMVESARTQLAGFGDRFDARIFDLGDRSWRVFPWPVRAVLSSLAIHHLDGRGKRALFKDMAGALAPGGALLIADVIKPATPAAHALAARAWDDAVRQRSLDLSGGLDPYEVFRNERWNLYADPEPDPADQPSTLLDQLLWLAEAGLTGVDVFWMKAGHAVFGGFRA
jgi:tRNA (cmo5U34)-methyltransferase